ncbi:MAG TPA: HDOD domain-containing protein [Albitalea sp.]|nr:HDOD domain-containing protein [Albitalea sp.]
MNTVARAAAAPSAAPRAKRPALPPPFPAVAVQLIQQMQLPATSAAEVARLIELDPSLTASLLRLVNSPFFGMRREIGSISEAVIVMGMSAVRRIVMSLAVATPLREQQADPAFAKEQWRHYVTCAALARRLIVDDPAASDLAFTAGLLHDMGQLHLLQQHGAAYVALHAEAGGGDVRALEIERFGQPHDTLGADLLEAWGLPQAIADAARHHHASLSRPGLTLVQQAVCAASRLAGCPPDKTAQVMSHCPDTLGSPANAIEQARAEIETLNQLLK